MTPLRQRMIEDLQLRGLSERTQEMYVRAVRQLAEHYHKSPARITEEELRQYFLYLKNVKHYARSASTIALCGIKFFYDHTLKRPWPTLTFVRAPREQKLPVVLSVEEVRTLLAHLKLLRYRACLTTIEQCRTEALGGHVSQCTACGALEYSYHACKNRHCPKCHNEEATKWLEQQRTLLLPVPYFLVTFPLPEALREVTRTHQHTLYNRLFQTSSAALKTLALDPKYLGGQLGMVGVLHTWTRQMASHPHVHYLVPGGALSSDESTWLPPRYAEWLLPVRALSTLFRGKCKAALTKADLLHHVPAHVWQQAWVTHGEPAGTGTEVLTYLAPYIRRIAISNNRIEKLEDGHVTFRFKESRSTEWKHLTLPAEEFIRRFLQHVLPKGFIKVRYYGFLSPSRRQGLAQARTLLAVCPRNDPAAPSSATQARHAPPPATEVALHCRQCGGQLVFLFRLVPNKRGPPA
jgi:hypothetical protein